MRVLEGAAVMEIVMEMLKAARTVEWMVGRWVTWPVVR